LSERACATGTTIIVENLFANVPARRKFLKRDVTEAAAVTVWVEKIALSQPSIAIKMIVDGSIKFETSGDGELKNAIYSIYGRDFASRLISVCSEIEGVEVKGYIGRSDNFKSNRNFQNFFINKRFIKSKTAMAALEQAYSSYIPSEKFPCCVLDIGLSPRAVDVNVHPAKLEVKFSNEKPVFDAIYYTVKTALEDDITRPGLELPSNKKPEFKNRSNAFVPVEDERKKFENIRMTFLDRQVKTQNEPPQTVVPPIIEKKPNIVSEPAITEHVTIEHKPIVNSSVVDKEALKAPERNELIEEITSKSKSEVEVKEEIKESANRECLAEESSVESKNETSDKITVSKVDYKLMGEAFNSYLFVEYGDKIVVIDKHAAHERLIFEELRERMAKTEIDSQILMIPIEVMLTTNEMQALESYKSQIEKIGFSLEFKKHSVLVSSIPSNINVNAVDEMIITFADRILNETGNIEISKNLIFERALYQASCKAAIKAGREYPKEHVEWLVDKLMQLQDITFCPHGRPIAIELSKNHLDHQFERK
jgi:DNA mismatch repair protein MutL